MAIRRPNGQWTVAKTPRGDWHHEEIKMALRVSGTTLEGLSRHMRLSTDACRIASRRPHFHGEMAIAEFLGLSPRQIWPSRYRADGTRIPVCRRRDKPTPPETVAHYPNYGISA